MPACSTRLQEAAQQLVEQALASLHAASGFSAQRAQAVDNANKALLATMGFGQGTLASDLQDDDDEDDEDDADLAGARGAPGQHTALLWLTCSLALLLAKRFSCQTAFVPPDSVQLLAPACLPTCLQLLHAPAWRSPPCLTRGAACLADRQVAAAASWANTTQPLRHAAACSPRPLVAPPTAAWQQACCRRGGFRPARLGSSCKQYRLLRQGQLWPLLGGGRPHRRL